MSADIELLTLLADARRERDRAEAELAEVARRQRELREALRAADRRISDLLGELVSPRPLLEYAGEKAVPPEPAADLLVESPDIPDVDPDLYPGTAGAVERYFRDGEHYPHDIEQRARISAFLGRLAAGDGKPRHGEWSEWTLRVLVASDVAAREVRVAVLHDRSDHLEFRGPVSETGYRSHFGQVPGDVEAHALRIARALLRKTGHAVLNPFPDGSWQRCSLDALSGLSKSDLKTIKKHGIADALGVADLLEIASAADMPHSLLARCGKAIEALKATDPVTPEGGAIVGPSGEAEDIGPSLPGPAPTWHSYPVEKILARANRTSLGTALAKEELGTAGAIAEFLSNGDELEDLEIEDEVVAGDLRKVRPLTDDEVRVIRGCLVEWIGEQGIVADFPLEWVDPTLTPLLNFQVQFKPTKSGERPMVYLRAASLLLATEYAGRYWPKIVKSVAPYPDRIPDGARVEEVPRDSYEDRVAAHRVERAARLEGVAS